MYGSPKLLWRQRLAPKADGFNGIVGTTLHLIQPRTSLGPIARQKADEIQEQAGEA